MSRTPRILIVVENLPAQRDARVRRECQALTAAGYFVSVISPRGVAGQEVPELAGVTLYQYPPSPERQGVLGFAYEFLYSWVATAFLVVKALLREGFDVFQACNPPETYFLLALPLKALGKPFVFDHHDLSPEHYAVQFGRRDLLYRLLLGLERATFRTADHVISTNEFFRDVALTRGGKGADDITVVRNGPPLDLVGDRLPQPDLRKGRTYLLCWVGVMRGFDDGVDLALAVVHHLLRRMGRDDFHVAFIGDGENLALMSARAAELGVEDHVTFTGWLTFDRAFDYLATADIALQTNPRNERTDVSTAIKTMEYMALGVPVVAFDLRETRASAGDAAMYAEPNDIEALAGLVDELLRDPDRRAAMGEHGRRRVRNGLAWDHQKTRYVSVFDRLLGGASD